MSGEIPTEDRVLAMVQQQVCNIAEVAKDTELLDTVIDFDLPYLYASIRRFYVLRGELGRLDEAVTDYAKAEQEEAETRTKLLAKYGIGSDDEAAELIANYWQGDRPESLLDCIKGFYSGENGLKTFKEAMQFATEATASDPEAKKMFRNANDLLFRDYKGGHG